MRIYRKQEPIPDGYVTIYEEDGKLWVELSLCGISSRHDCCTFQQAEWDFKDLLEQYQKPLRDAPYQS